MKSRYKIKNGCAQYTIGAQGGVFQPPYVIRYKNKWYRTEILNNLSVEQARSISAMPRLDYGVSRCTNYLIRTHKKFSDLYLWNFSISAEWEQKTEDRMMKERKMYNTEIWVKAKYSENNIRKLVRIVFNPYGNPAKEILKEWILPEYWHQCIAYNVNIKRRTEK